MCESAYTETFCGLESPETLKSIQDIKPFFPDSHSYALGLLSALCLLNQCVSALP